MDSDVSNIKNQSKRTTKQTPLKTQQFQELEAKSLEDLIIQHNELLEKDRKLTEELVVWSKEGEKALDLSAEMQALHEYNETKDFAQVVLGYLADFEQVMVKKIHEKYNLPTE